MRKQVNFYKEKLEFLEGEHKGEIRQLKERLKEARNRSVGDSIISMTEIEDEEEEAIEFASDKPVPWETFEKFREQQENKYRNKIVKMKKQLEKAKTDKKNEAEIKEIANLSGANSDERQKTMHKLLTEKQNLTRELSEIKNKNEKYQHSMKAFAQRESYNDKLRRNWQTQLRQMEQALLLSNQINNQNRAKYQTTITEKDSEIAKLRAYVTHQLHRQRNMRRGTRIARPVRPVKKGGPKKVIRRGGEK
eukprot:UN28894